jgi:hypothetical protein
MNLIAGYSVTLLVNIKEVYASLIVPVWAPATWVFGAVWTVNNILVLIGNIWTLNLPHSSDRTKLIWLQIFSWSNYAVFQWLSFGTRIPSLYFWPSFTLLIATLASMYYAYRLDTVHRSFSKTVVRGKSITIMFSTLLVWLLIANALGFFIMTHN